MIKIKKKQQSKVATQQRLYMGIIIDVSKEFRLPMYQNDQILASIPPPLCWHFSCIELNAWGITWPHFVRKPKSVLRMCRSLSGMRACSVPINIIISVVCLLYPNKISIRHGHQFRSTAMPCGLCSNNNGICLAFLTSRPSKIEPDPVEMRRPSVKREARSWTPI